MKEEDFLKDSEDQGPPFVWSLEDIRNRKSKCDDDSNNRGNNNGNNNGSGTDSGDDESEEEEEETGYTHSHEIPRTLTKRGQLSVIVACLCTVLRIDSLTPTPSSSWHLRY